MIKAPYNTECDCGEMIKKGDLCVRYQGYWDETINLIFFKVDPVDFRENIKTLFVASPLFALFLSFIGVFGIILFFLVNLFSVIGEENGI